MKSLRLIAIAAALCVVSTANAGFYGKIAGLYNSPGDIKYKNAAGETDFETFKASLKDNVAIAGAVGYKFSKLRAELELQYLSADVEDGRAYAEGELVGEADTTSGDYKQFDCFVNVYVDLPGIFGLSPYIGAGLGMAKVDLDKFNVSAETGEGETAAAAVEDVVKFNDGETVFGYQLMAGVQFSIFEQATIGAGYRYIWHDNISINEIIEHAKKNVKSTGNHVFELSVSIGY